MDRILSSLPQPLWLVAQIVGLLVGGYLFHGLLFFVARRAVLRTATRTDDRLVSRCRGPSRLAMPLLAVHLWLPLLSDGRLHDTLRPLTGTALILCAAWLLSRVTLVAQDAVLERYQLVSGDADLSARKVHTQIRILRRIALVGIGIVTLAAIFMSFDRLRQFGTGLLASAGIVGVVVGFAAQRTLGNLLAGVQIAFSQPMRVEDVLVVEGEWGRVEEITLTYVVLRLWDQRRLVMPISYFIEKPFQNWTRSSAEILGTVFVRTDYTVDVDGVRAELQRIVEATPLWDRRTANLQVTDLGERTVELRALVSAADASKAWDLRCLVRERLLVYLREQAPADLPRVRTLVSDLVNPPTENTAAAAAATRVT
jgi:small-conductance mechanosensitive channel